MEEKHRFLIIFNFVLFPIVMIIVSVLTFQGTDTHIEYVAPEDATCPSEGYIKKGNFCYLSECFDKEDTCDKIPVTCPAGKSLNADGLCYSLIQYSDPIEAHCLEGYFKAVDVCLPNDVTIEEHETRQKPLECPEDRGLWNHRCFVVSDLVEEPCHTKKKQASLDNNSNTCNASNKSEEKAVKCNSTDNANEEQVSFNNKCYKERRIIVNAKN